MLVHHDAKYWGYSGAWHNVTPNCSVSYYIWAPSSEIVSSSIPLWHILTVHAQPFREARDLAFCLKVPLDSQLVWASSGGSGESGEWLSLRRFTSKLSWSWSWSARMRRLAWTFAARISDKYQIRLTRSNYDLIQRRHIKTSQSNFKILLLFAALAFLFPKI